MFCQFHVICPFIQDEQIEEITKTAYQYKLKYEKANSGKEVAINYQKETRTKLADTGRKSELLSCTKSDSLSKVSATYDLKETTKCEGKVKTDISSLEEDLDSLLSVEAPTNRNLGLQKVEVSEDVPNVVTSTNKLGMPVIIHVF